MGEQEEENTGPEQTDRHGMDAADKPGGGAKSADNPVEPSEPTEDKDAPGQGSDAEAAAGSDPEGSEGTTTEQPHGQSGR
ncbi:MAG: hypothetical protein ACR2K6_10715 [Solirubrobacterales bacterium]